MPKNAYFAGYQYPPNSNIIIVPTVSFSPPPRHTGTEQITKANTSSSTIPTLICEQITPIKDNIGDGEPSASPCRSNCNQQNLQVMCSNTSTSIEFLDNLKNSLCVQGKISTEAPAFNKSQSTQEMSTSKYKSRHNLVDLTGFNLPKRKRDTTSLLLRHKDLRQIDDTKIEQNKTRTSDDAKHRDYSASDSYKTDNISKESSTSTHSERNTENLACGEAKKSDMETKMKKYFKQLWNRSFEKLKDKAAKEKHGRVIKSSSKTRKQYKDSKEESSRGQANLQKVSNSNSTKDLRKKIIDSSKKYCDLERRFMAKYTKRSKSETNSGHLPDSKVPTRERTIDLSPDSNKRFKDFQRFIRPNDDNEIKQKSGNQIKTENLSHNKIRLKSCVTTTNKPVIKKKVDECKKSIKSEKRSKVNTNHTNLERVKNYTDMERTIDKNNTDRVKLIKSVVGVDKSFHNNLSQSKRVRSCIPVGVQDLRLRLSRKRAKSEYFEPIENRLDSETLMITVKQDVKTDSKSLPILAPTVNKPKPKKCKRIKLIINIECPNSNSDNSDQDLNECCSSSEDLSFLDDLNIDEIVDSLNNSQVEPKKTTTIDSDYKNNEQPKPKEGLINNVNMKAIKITKKEETSSPIGQVIEINSDTEDDDMNIEIGSVANTKKCEDEQHIQTNSKFDRNTKQEANYITDLNGKGYEENAPKVTIDLCKDEQNIKTNSLIGKNTKQEAYDVTDLNEKYCDKNAAKENINLCDDDSVVEVIDISDDNEQYTTSKHPSSKKTIQASTLAKKVNLSKSKFQFKPSVNKITGLENTKSHNIQHEDKTDITAKQKLDPTNVTDIKQTAFLQTMFNIEQNKSINSIGVQSDVIQQLNTLDKIVKEKNDNSHNSEDTVEASLEAMFNNCEQNGGIRKHIEQNKINGCDQNIKRNSIQKSVDAVEVSLEAIFNSTKYQDTDINMDTEQLSSGQHIQKEIDKLQTAQVMIKVPLETMSNIVDQKKKMNEIKIELSNLTDKHIKIESESQEPVNQILPETTKAGIEQNAEIKINSEPLNVSNIKINRLQKSGSISNKKSLETEENILENANDKMDIIPVCRSSKNVKEHLQTFKDTVNKPKDKPINNIEKKTNNVIPLPQSKSELLFDARNSTKGTLETAKSFAENCMSSPQIDIRPQSSLGQNNKPKGEPLQKSVETIKPSKVSIDYGEQKINIRSESNKSDKNIEENTLLENSEVKSEKSPERSNIQNKTNVTTSVELSNPDKYFEIIPWKTLIAKAEKLFTANNKETTVTSKKLNVENQTKSETVKNNTHKLETIDDACDLNKITIKDSELGKRYKQAHIFRPPMQPFLSKLESRMSEYLQTKYTLSVIHNGRFSTIYKCFDPKGETYAVKVVKQREIGIFMEGMLFLLQQYRSRQASFVLYLMSTFEVEYRWCLITEYYPKNLIQALHGYTHGFHIDQVQVLSRQLVDAVNMLTNAGVIHSDIKPTHILLNSTHDRLKLCGFDRSNFSSCTNITPNTGTPSYRAPEVILGFQEDHRIDLWSTALVMFEMATNKTLFMEGPNNVILYQQLCTFGSVDYSMLEQSRFGAVHFSGTSFKRTFYYNNYEDTVLVHSLQKNENLRRTLFQSYEGQWPRGRTKWQMWKDMNKLELLHTLLEQMLVLDPRYRLPIQFVGPSEFMNH